ncbi:sensor domain-containing diguanylate cyclase [Deinococcus sp. HMF7604]|uniref:GGDEF domain-containing protein n=1 Tax=Deinococcus betulae TaxID=2873312 RepID=UPI001CC94E10|nr:sensor domain-containing diguanylate cyclase [Deinococcus betulae]
MTTSTADAQRQIARYRSLVQVTAALARHARTPDLLRTMHAQVQALFATPVTLLARRLPGGGWHCLTLESDSLDEQNLPPRTDGLLERVLNGQLRLQNDLRAYVAREGLKVVRVHFRHDLPHTLSWMGVPLHVGDEEVGVLSVQSYDLDAFTDEDLEFLELLGVHLSIALENAALHEQVQREANTDPLTGLPNRRTLTGRVQDALGSGQPHTLAVMDVQDFKSINDGHGHPVGDEVLIGVASLLGDLVRTAGFVCRLGGDEFAALLPWPQTESEARLADFLDRVAAFSWPVPQAPRLNVGAVAAWPGATLSDWLRQADARMYSAKRQRVQLLRQGAD